MHKKINLVIVFSAFLLTMCRGYAEPVSTLEGLSCRPYTAYLQDGLSTSKGLECHYTCPDGTVVGPFDAPADPSLSATEGDLDRQLCGIAPPTFTPMEPTATTSPTAVPSPTLEVTATGAILPTIEATLTAEIPATGESSVLTGRVTMCDTGVNLISFRIVQPLPDLTGKTLTVQIAEQESACYVNQTNPSLMTCTIPAGVTFPV
ncbi:MAG: hypothetical protein EHM33_22445, partial [Chloroflexi bacterium]